MSDTSSELNIDYIDGNTKVSNNDIKKRETSETDMYLNMLANPNKIMDEPEVESTSLQLDETESAKLTSSVNNSSSKSSDRSSVSSKANFENVEINSSRYSSRKRSRRDSEKSTHSSVNIETAEVEAPVVLTPQQIRAKKTELLRKLSEIKQKGYKLSREYDFNSSIEDMECEYDLLKSIADKRNGVKLYKNILLNACSVIEFMNDKYDPFSFQLSGWSEHMSVEVDSYEDVLEELYEKYKGKGSSLPPELKLLLLILASASAFHFSKAHLSNMPGAQKAATSMATNLTKNMVNGNNNQSQFMSPEEIRIKQQTQALQEKERELNERIRQSRLATQSQPSAPVPQQMRPQMDTFKNSHFPINQSAQPTAQIKAPENVADILNRLHSRDNNSVTETQEETSINNDRIVSDTMSESKRKKKKNLMVIQ